MSNDRIVRCFIPVCYRSASVNNLHKVLSVPLLTQREPAVCECGSWGMGEFYYYQWGMGITISDGAWVSFTITNGAWVLLLVIGHG